MLIIILSPNKIPHEIAEVHFTHLVFQEKAKVIRKGDLIGLFHPHDFLVVLNMAGLLVRPHAREEALVRVLVVREGCLAIVHHLILALCLREDVIGTAVFVRLARIQLRVETLAIKDGP